MIIDCIADLRCCESDTNKYESGEEHLNQLAHTCGLLPTDDCVQSCARRKHCWECLRDAHNYLLGVHEQPMGHTYLLYTLPVYPPRYQGYASQVQASATVVNCSPIGQ